MSVIKDLIDYPHPVHKNYHDYWQFLLESYEGGVDYCRAEIANSGGLTGLKQWAFKLFAGSKEVKSTASGNLFMHPKERQKDYNDRLAMPLSSAATSSLL